MKYKRLNHEATLMILIIIITSVFDKITAVGYYSGEIYLIDVSLFLISSGTFSRQFFLAFFFIFAAVLACSCLRAACIANEARYKAASKIAAWRSTTKPQGKANWLPFPSSSPWISNDRQWTLSWPILQYSNTGGGYTEYTDQLVLDVPRRRHMHLSTWGEIDDHVDKWVPTAFLSVSPGCSSLVLRRTEIDV